MGCPDLFGTASALGKAQGTEDPAAAVGKTEVNMRRIDKIGLAGGRAAKRRVLEAFFFCLIPKGQ